MNDAAAALPATMGSPELTISCCYTGPDLKSHFTPLELIYRPSKPHLAWTPIFDIKGWKSARHEPGFTDWHTNPNPALSILLHGQIETIVGDGTSRISSPGHMSVSLDSQGQGHQTRVIGPGPAYSLAMLLTAEQFAALRDNMRGWPTDILLPFAA